MARLKELTPRIGLTLPSRVRFLDSAGGAAKAHYKSADHLAWAREVKARDRYTCQDCGARGAGVRLIADHVLEVADGGARLDVGNGRTRCQACHNAKTARSKADRMGR